MSLDESFKSLIEQSIKRGEENCPMCGVEMRLHDSEQIEKCYKDIYDKKDHGAFVRHAFAAKAWSVAMKIFTESYNESWNTFHDWEPPFFHIRATEENLESWAGAINMTNGNTDWGGAYFWGPPGTGKTHAARLILFLESLSFQKSAEVTAYSLMQMASDYRHTEDIEMFSRVELLLIDDIDKCIWTEKSTMALWDIINHRSEIGARTIITSNVEPDNLRGIFNSGSNSSVVESMMQRLHPIEILEFKGESVRDWIWSNDKQ